MERKNFQIYIIAILFVLTCSITPSSAKEIELNSAFSLTLALLGDKVHNPNVAYNTQHGEYLVVYQWSNPLIPGTGRQIHGARIGVNGNYIENIIISDQTNDCASPDVAYDPILDRYLITWMFDKNGDGSNWDLLGRFISTNSAPLISSFTISQIQLVDEYYPRVVYGSSQNEFVIVINAFRNDSAPILPYILGFRIKADGSNIVIGGNAPDITISHGTENRVRPKIAYNSIRDEYMVVYDNAYDIYATIYRAFNLSPRVAEFGIAGWPDTEDIPEVDFSPKKDIYVVTWDSKRLSGNGEVYGRFINGDGSVGTVFRLDDDIGGVRPDFTTAVTCRQSSDECLVYWISIKNNTYYTFGRQIHAGGSIDSGFPYNNLNTVASWGSDEPQLAIASGPKNFLMGFKNNTGGQALSIWAQTTKIVFPWNLYLPSIVKTK